MNAWSITKFVVGQAVALLVEAFAGKVVDNVIGEDHSGIAKAARFGGYLSGFVIGEKIGGWAEEEMEDIRDLSGNVKEYLELKKELEELRRKEEEPEDAEQ